MVLALLLSNFNRNATASRLLPWLLGMNNSSVITASSALGHRAGFHLKQCVVSNARSSSSLLSQSLCVNPWDDAGDDENNNNKQDDDEAAAASPDVHLIVLIHGWMGNPKEMDGLKESLMEQSQIRMDAEKENTFNTSQKQQHAQHRVVVHSVKCNEGRTFDGIAAGGQRVAVEINQVIQEIWNQQEKADDDNSDDDKKNNKRHHRRRRPNIKLTIVGNSLGGLYGRYAVSEIDWTTTHHENNNNDDDDDDPSAQLIPHYFVTTATPHLGCGFQQTYLPLPRFIEHPIGNIMLRTGQDLFRLDSGKNADKPDIIQEMTFSPTFTTPLSKFYKRMAYANAHGTDFQVPLPTAAFWAPTDSIHHTLMVETTPNNNNSNEREDDNNNKENNNNQIVNNNIPRGVALTVTTPRKEITTMSSITEPKDDVATSEEISRQLDQLGWTKVLIDVRHEMPINLNEPNTYTTTTTTTFGSSTEESSPPPPPKQEWTAKELLQEFDNGRLKSLPIGHMVMVANSKNEFYRNMCKSGIPIMDYLAREIINSI